MYFCCQCHRADLPSSLHKVPNDDIMTRLCCSLLQKFIAINGYYTANMSLLELPMALVSGDCHVKITIDVINTYKFKATSQAEDPRLDIGHVRDDRLIWFTKTGSQLEM